MLRGGEGERQVNGVGGDGWLVGEERRVEEREVGEREVEEREVGEERQRFRQAVASMRPEEVFPHRVRWQRHGNQTQPSMHDLINVGINPCPLSTEKRLTKV